MFLLSWELNRWGTDFTKANFDLKAVSIEQDGVTSQVSFPYNEIVLNVFIFNIAKLINE